MSGDCRPLIVSKSADNESKSADNELMDPERAAISGLSSKLPNEPLISFIFSTIF